jgi:SAM-dependent methyltransferase
MSGEHADVWGIGDYGIVSRQTVLMSELLCEAVDLRAGERVVDVACGDGNTALSAARRGADVTALDLTATLLERGRRRASSDSLTINFQLGDAERLPFADASFDVALSTIGVMFARDQVAAARELIRVTRPGGRVGLANWTPAGFHGRLIRLLDEYSPPEQSKSGRGARPAALWGTPEHIDDLFGASVSEIATRRREVRFRFRSVADWLDQHERLYGPLMTLRRDLDDAARERLTNDLTALVTEFDESPGPDLLIPSEYLEVVIEL